MSKPRIEHVRALLVEDDAEDADIFRRHVDNLRHYAVEITWATSAVDAWRAAAEGSPDVVFLDLNLAGGGDGMELLRTISVMPTAPPVIVVTGSGDEERAAETMRGGAADYLVKDRLSADLLERTIRSAREKHFLERQRQQMMRRLAELSIIDDLTAVANRRHLMAKLEEELLRAERTGHGFAVLMIDVDYFKEINDRSGHQTGDRVLRLCAETLRRTVRAIDFVARYGGDEFCMLLPETERSGALRLAERLRETVHGLPEPTSTISIGIALWAPGASRDGLLREADDALYAAKEAGRNQAVAYPDLQSARVAAS